MSRPRYVYRVMVNGAAVRHFQTLQAAQHRACEWSTRRGYVGAVITVERSQPVEFECAAYTAASFRDGVRL